MLDGDFNGVRSLRCRFPVIEVVCCCLGRCGETSDSVAIACVINGAVIDGGHGMLGFNNWVTTVAAIEDGAVIGCEAGVGLLFETIV